MAARKRDAERVLDLNGTPDELVAAVLRRMPDAALVVDATGQVVAANAVAEAMFGYPLEGLQGLAIEDLVPERFRAGHARHRSSYGARSLPRR